MSFSGDPPPVSNYASVDQSMEMYESGVRAGFTSTPSDPSLRPVVTPVYRPMRMDVSLNTNTVTASLPLAPILDFYAFQQQQQPPPPPGVYTNLYYDYVSTFIHIMISLLII